MSVTQPPVPESFIKKQLKLAFSTATIASIGTLTVTFWINVGIISLVLLLIGIGAAFAGESAANGLPKRSYTTIYGSSDARHKILSIPIDGPIEGSNNGAVPSIFNYTGSVYGYDLKQEIEDAADSGNYSGLVLEVNSPGGTIYGSKAIADGVAYFKKHTGKPVYASVQGLAASGSYWASASADKIIADSGTGIGSIGVIYGPFTFYDKPLADANIITENGIEQTYITAGEGKDEGNPFRRLTDEEKIIMQISVDDSYNQFVNYVAKRRDLSVFTIKSTIGAHLFGEQQALKSGLIDGIDSREEVYYQAAEADGISGGDFQIVSSHVGNDDFLSVLGAKAFGPAKKAVGSDSKPLVCTGSVSVPLAFQGSPSAGCK